MEGESGEFVQAPEDKAHSKDGFGVELVATEELRAIASALTSTPIDPDEVSERIIQGLDEQTAVKTFAETHVENVIERMHSQGFDIDSDVVLDGAETENFKFKHEDGGLVAVDKSTAREVAKYGFIIMVNGVPVIVDVKASKARTSLNKAKKIEAVKQKFAPIKERFPDAKSFGYLLIGLQRSDVSPRTPADSLIEDNGILTALLPISYVDLRGHVDNLVAQRTPQSPPAIDYFDRN